MTATSTARKEQTDYAGFDYAAFTENPNITDLNNAAREDQLDLLVCPWSGVLLAVALWAVSIGAALLIRGWLK